VSLTGLFHKLLRRRGHYRAVFESESGKAVLADLKRFSGFMDGAAVISPLRQQVDVEATFIRIGRQEMFQRIVTHLNIDDAQLLRLQEQAEQE
jgi:hypothetical protein